MQIKATLMRDGKQAVVILRQLPHDERLREGSKVKWGSGRKWTVIRTAPLSQEVA